jgi:hypothetical protein
MFYRVNNNKLIDYADYEYIEGCKETDIITQQELDEHPNKVIVEDNELVLNPNYEEEEDQKERERIANLSLTKRDVFLALYKDKGITPEQIKAQIQDPEALIEFEYASSYYRGNPLIDAIGQALGYTKEQLDYLFEHKELPVGE